VSRVCHHPHVTPPPPSIRGQLSADGRQYFDGPDWGWQDLWVPAATILDVSRAQFSVPVLRATLLADGMLNQSWRISCSDHDRVLRVGRRERTVEQVAYERVAAAAWAAVVPEVVTAEHDDVPVIDGHTLTLFPFVHGASGAGVPGPERAGILAPKLAAMHRASLVLGLHQRPGFAAIDDHPPWFDWEHTRVAMLERFGHGRDVTSPIEVVDRATAEHDDLLDEWQRDGRLSQRATVHGDLNPRNQLYGDGQLVGIIDTDDCRVEPLLWDLANLAYSDAATSPTAVWTDYIDAGGPLEPAAQDLLVHIARIGALTELRWLTDEDGPSHLALDHLVALAGQLTGGVRRDA